MKVFSLGQTTVVFSEALKHRELLFTNDKRNIQPAEIDFTLDKLLSVDRSQANVIMGHHLAEVSVPVPTPTVEV
ncbi:hypothetical protein IV56_GL000978 [Lacticaseibacillus saniviri JCM 17471 = DSM 24301]|uniref:DUF2922 domain-containing protein n=1 Tax=Lacticaseibacillus saniviri JCM 17471 = DSM 24301 TaxID=1293598 RepID=A0A0R2MWS8_9LACO|nr:hypothetical protein IV56_GL000978 [Lacticaseibacillus saniviri JCM 17471 = DSM 24301]